MITNFTEGVKKPKSIGKELRELYLSKQPTVNIDKYETLAEDILDKLATDLKKRIEDGEDPLVSMKALDTQSGIITSMDGIPSHFKDQLFHMILAEKADEKDLIVEFKMAMDNVNGNPVQIPILVCTFK